MNTLAFPHPVDVNHGMLIKGARLGTNPPYYWIDIRKETGDWISTFPTKPVFLLPGCVKMEDSEKGLDYPVLVDPGNEDGDMATVGGAIPSLQAAAVLLRVRNRAMDGGSFRHPEDLPVPARGEAGEYLARQPAEY